MELMYYNYTSSGYPFQLVIHLFTDTYLNHLIKFHYGFYCDAKLKKGSVFREEHLPTMVV